MDFNDCKEIIKKLLKEKNCLTRDEILNIVEYDESVADRIYQCLVSEESIAIKASDSSLQYVSDQIEDCSENGNLCFVFISYGRECKGIKLAYRLNKDLKERSDFRGWIDFKGIHGGDDWKIRIMEAIKQSKVLLAVITPHAMREGSWCLNEIEFAFRNNKEVIPLTIEHGPNYIDLSLVRKHYLDFSQDAKYEINFKLLLRALQGDRTGLIKPISKIADEESLDFGREIAIFSKNFSGREWIKKEIDEWLQNPDDKQIFLIIGDIGSGKSAITAWLSKVYPEQAVGIHFCLRNSEKNSPVKFVVNIAAQLSEKVKGFKELIQKLNLSKADVNASDVFRRLIINPICSKEIVVPDKPVFILVDGLDEAKLQKEGPETILTIITEQSRFLPPWMRIIATTRPNRFIKDVLSNSRRLEMKKNKQNNDTDIRKYLEERFTEVKLRNTLDKSGADRNEVITNIVKQAKGIFLYAVLAGNLLSEGKSPDDLPQEFSGFFVESFSSIFSDEKDYQKIRPLLAIITIAREPLSAEEISFFSGTKTSEVRSLLAKIEDFLPLNESKKYEAFHISFIEWLKGEIGECDTYRIDSDDSEDGIRLMADSCYKEYRNGILSMRPYTLKYITIHLLEAGQEERLAEVLVDPAYFVTMWKKDEYALKANWVQIEKKSHLQIIKVYDPVLKNPDNTGNDEFIFCLSEFLDDTDHRMEAISLFEYLMNIYIEKDDKRKLLYVLSSTAWSLYLQNKQHNALQLLKLSEYFSTILDDSDGLQRAYFYSASIEEQTPQKNMILFRLQQKICEDLDDEWARAYWLQLSYGNEGILFSIIGDAEESMRLYKLKETICQERGIKQGLQWAYGYQATQLIEQENYSKARELLVEQERIAESIGYIRGLKNSLERQRYIFQKQNNPRLQKKTEEKLKGIHESDDITIQEFNYQKIITNLKESYQRRVLARDSSGPEDRVKILGVLATVYELEGDMHAAMKLFKEQEELAINIYPKFFILSLLSQMRILAKNKEYDKALGIYKSIPKNIVSYRDHTEIHLILMDIGNNLLSINLTQAEVVFKEIWNHYLNNVTYLREIISSKYFKYVLPIIKFPLNGLYSTGKFRDSIEMAELLEKVASTFDNNNDILSYTLAYQGLSYEALGNFEKALSLYNRQAKIIDIGENVRDRVWVAGNQGDVLRKLGILDQARAKYIEQKDLAEKSQLSNWVISALENLGSISENCGDFEIAIENYKQQEVICRKYGAPDLYRTFERQGEIWLRKGDLNQALEFFKEMENTLGALENEDCLARAIGYQSVALHAQGQVTRSLDFIDKKGMVLSSIIPVDWHKRRMNSQDEVHWLAKETDYEYQSIKVDREFLKKLSEITEVDPAAQCTQLFEKRAHAIEIFFQVLIEYYSKLEQVCEGTGYQMGLQYATGNKGVISMIKENWGESAAALSRMEQICSEIRYPYGLQLAYGRQADLKTELGEYQDALALSIKQETICRDMKLREDQGICLGRKALIQYYLGNYAKSLTLFQQMEGLASELGLLYLQQKSMEGQGLVNQKINNFTAAISNFLNQERICHRIGDPRLICIALVNKKQLYDTMGENQQSQLTMSELNETVKCFK